MNNTAFMLGFLKEAAPRWIKEIRKGRLGAKSLKRLKGISGVREVKRLGHGGEQIADLVFHPKHGLSVRKTPLLASGHPKDVAYQRESARKRLRLWKDIFKHRGAGKHFARVLEGKGPVSIHEYIPSKLKRPPLEQRAGKLLKKIEAMSSSKMKRLGVDKYYEGGHAEVGGARQRRVLKHVSGRAPLHPEAEKILASVKKKHPGLHDIRRPNVIRGKLIDVSPELRHVITKRPYPKGVQRRGLIASSRREFLGGKEKP